MSLHLDAELLLAVADSRTEVQSLTDPMRSEIGKLLRVMQKPYSGVKMQDYSSSWFWSTPTLNCFAADEVVTWMRGYINGLSRDSAVHLGILMTKLGMIEALQSSTKASFGAGEMFHVTREYRPRLVIVGGGMSGFRVVKALNDRFNIVLVDREGTMDLVPIYPIIIEDAKNLEEISFSHKQSFGNKAVCITGVVKSVTDSHAIVETIETVPQNLLESSNSPNTFQISYDYIIFASGSTCWDALKDISVSPNSIHFVNPYSGESLAESHSVISLTEDAICVLGGGFVGVEMAGALAHKYPNREIVIIHRSSHLMKSETIHKSVTSMFSQMKNVKVMMNAHLIGVEDSNQLKIKTNTGEETIKCSACFVCTGMKPQTDYLQHTFADSLDSKGFVRVNPHMQVMKNETESHANIYAIGDITNFEETKLANCAHKHAKTASNVLSLVSQSKPVSSLPSYNARGFSQNQTVIIGPNHGLFVKGETVWLNNWVIGFMKEMSQRGKAKAMKSSNL